MGVQAVLDDPASAGHAAEALDRFRAQLRPGSELAAGHEWGPRRPLNPSTTKNTKAAPHSASAPGRTLQCPHYVVELVCVRVLFAAVIHEVDVLLLALRAREVCAGGWVSRVQAGGPVRLRGGARAWPACLRASVPFVKANPPPSQRCFTLLCRSGTPAAALTSMSPSPQMISSSIMSSSLSIASAPASRWGRVGGGLVMRPPPFHLQPALQLPTHPPCPSKRPRQRRCTGESRGPAGSRPSGPGQRRLSPVSIPAAISPLCRAPDLSSRLRLDRPSRPLLGPDGSDTGHAAGRLRRAAGRGLGQGPRAPVKYWIQNGQVRVCSVARLLAAQRWLGAVDGVGRQGNAGNEIGNENRFERRWCVGCARAHLPQPDLHPTRAVTPQRQCSSPRTAVSASPRTGPQALRSSGATAAHQRDAPPPTRRCCWVGRDLPVSVRCPRPRVVVDPLRAPSAPSPTRRRGRSTLEPQRQGGARGRVAAAGGRAPLAAGPARLPVPARAPRRGRAVRLRRFGLARARL